MNTKITTLRLPKELADELDVVARVDRLPVSELVRAAIYRFIADRRSEPDFKERLNQVAEEDRKTLERLAA
jgi:Arc/MetJ-type ribon-helix-helix transcriptional regulator